MKSFQMKPLTGLTSELKKLSLFTSDVRAFMKWDSKEIVIMQGDNFLCIPASQFYGDLDGLSPLQIVAQRINQAVKSRLSD